MSLSRRVGRPSACAAGWGQPALPFRRQGAMYLSRRLGGSIASPARCGERALPFEARTWFAKSARPVRPKPVAIRNSGIWSRSLETPQIPPSFGLSRSSVRELASGYSASNPPQEEKAACGASPDAGLPLTRTPKTLLVWGSWHVKRSPPVRPAGLVAVVAG